MTTSETIQSILHILRQGPRLSLEAVARTSSVNEAYLMVHGAMARAMDGNTSAATSPTLSCDDQSAIAEQNRGTVL